MMADNEKSSDRISTIASKAMREPGSLSNAEIKALGASALTQSNDVAKPKPAAAKAAPKPAPKAAPPKTRR